MMYMICRMVVFFFFCKQKTAYEMRISDWSSDVCSSDLQVEEPGAVGGLAVEDGADDAVPIQDQPLVDAARHVAQDDLRAAQSLGEVAGGEQVEDRKSVV